MSTIPRKPDGTFDDRAFINTPDLWPHWPHLPMKKRMPSGGWPKLGTLVDANLEAIGADLRFPVELHVSDGENPMQVTEVKKFNSVEEILADGWIVD